jgi:hypothetical protein
MPIDLLAREPEMYRNVAVAYRDGLRYRWLQRIDATRDLLSEILVAP